MVNVLLLGTAAQVSDEARGPLLKELSVIFSTMPKLYVIYN